MKRNGLILALLPLLLTGCASTGDKVTTYYDADGNPIRQVNEDVYNGKYSMYKDAIVGLANAVKESKNQIIQAIKELAAPRPGESSDLSAYKQGIDANKSGTSCLGPLAGLQSQHQLYKDTVQALSDPQATTLVLVRRAERSSLAEAERSSGEMAALGVRNQHLVVNAVFQAQRADDPIARAMQQRGQDALAALPKGLTEFPRTELPLAPHNLIGVPALRAMLDKARAPRRIWQRANPVTWRFFHPPWRNSSTRSPSRASA